MNNQNTINYLKSGGYDQPEDVKEWSELSYEDHIRVARILVENGETNAHDSNETEKEVYSEEVR